MHLVGSERTDTRSVWVVRHGESTWNAQGRMQRQVDHPPLTAKGVTQAYAAGYALQGKPIQRVISSDAVRARQTAAAICTVLGVGIVIDPRLRERDWAPGARPGSGPARLEDPSQRVAECIRDIAGFDGDSAVVTHGDIVCVLLDMFSARTPENAQWVTGTSVPNGAVIPMRLHRLRTGT